VSIKPIFSAAAVVAFLITCVPLAQAQSTDRSKVTHSPNNPTISDSADVWDANHDGIYTCDEWKGYLGRLFDLADVNRDGNLDPSEFARVRKASRLFADADFGYFDENQDGKITRGEFVDKPNEIFLQFDKNGDCRVTQDELKGGNSTDRPTNSRGKRF
jgi:hypothetical protein